jgi:hypothetical protein
MIPRKYDARDDGPMPDALLVDGIQPLDLVRAYDLDEGWAEVILLDDQGSQYVDPRTGDVAIERIESRGLWVIRGHEWEKASQCGVDVVAPCDQPIGRCERCGSDLLDVSTWDDLSHDRRRYVHGLRDV